MTPALARALRTLAQAVLAALGTISVATIFNGIDPGVAGMVQVVLTAVIAQAQNMLEDHGVIPAVLKPVPEPTPPVVTPQDGP